MKNKSSFKEKFLLFLIFAKLGLFSFGGGTTMLTLLESELVEKRKWLNDDELMEMTAISESTPGPIAVNLATYLGYKKAGVLGSILATLGVVLPSFIIMFLIALLFKNMLQYKVVQWIFMGIKCGVVFLIIDVAIKLIKGIGKNPLAIVLFVSVAILMILFTLFSISFSAIYFILIGALLGILTYVFVWSKNKKKGENK